MDKLISGRAWVRRRVETISILDERMLDRRVTIDVDLKLLREWAVEAGIDPASLPIPLVALEKQLQLELDVRDSAGSPVPVWVSDDDAHASHAYLLAVMQRHKIDLAQVPDEVLGDLYQIVRLSNASEVLADLGRQIVDGLPCDPEVRGSRPLSSDDISAWRLLLQQARASGEVDTLITELAWRYHLMIDAAPLPAHAGVAILKYRRIDTWSQPADWSTEWSNRLGFAPYNARIPAPGIATADREHTRVVAPAEVTVRSTVPMSPTGKPLPPRSYDARVDLSRSVVYTSSESVKRRGDYSLAVKLRPRRGAFLVPGAFATSSLALLLSAGFILELLRRSFSQTESPVDAAVAVILILPSLLAVELVRKGEHRLVSQMLLVPRLTTLVAALAAVAAAGAIAAQVGHRSTLIVLGAAAIVCIVAALYLIAISVLISRR